MRVLMLSVVVWFGCGVVFAGIPPVGQNHNHGLSSVGKAAVTTLPEQPTWVDESVLARDPALLKRVQTSWENYFQQVNANMIARGVWSIHTPMDTPERCRAVEPIKHRQIQ